MFKPPDNTGEAKLYLFDRDFSGPQKRAAAAPATDPETVRKMAYEEGLKAGEQAGFQSGLQQATGLLAQLEQIVQNMETARATLLEIIEGELVDLVFRISEKVIHHEIASDPELKRSIISAGLRSLKESERIMIRLSPADLEFIQAGMASLKESNDVQGSILLEPDPAIAPGDFILETDSCELDARVEKVLQSIQEALKNK